MTSVENNDENLELAFGLTLFAGSATLLGALGPLITPLQNKSMLAGALGLSSGVMLFISFVDVYGKSIEAFEEQYADHANGERDAAWAALGCFFAGIFLLIMVNAIVHKFVGRDHDLAFPDPPAAPSSAGTASTVDQFGREVALDVYTKPEPSEAGVSDHHQLHRTGLLAAIAIAGHNVPEGMIVFIGALASERIGVSLAFAVALHNIPEGLSVAMPIFYATGSKLKGFLYAAASGLAEPIGALLAYLVFREVFNDAVYGVLFGLVAGMMVWITQTELIPTGQRYDKAAGSSVFFPAFLAGMAVMGASINLFL